MEEYYEDDLIDDDYDLDDDEDVLAPAPPPGAKKPAVTDEQLAFARAMVAEREMRERLDAEMRAEGMLDSRRRQEAIDYAVERAWDRYFAERGVSPSERRREEDLGRVRAAMPADNAPMTYAAIEEMDRLEAEARYRAPEGGSR
jgi:hypothetical protein